MNKSVRERLGRSRAWIYRNARPVDLARCRFHFENGAAGDVLAALAAYQNDDGGFGHALEPDCWNPNSSPIQTWAAVEILREIGFDDKNHETIRGILRYLDSGKDFSHGVWQNCVPTNNDYPCAPWWRWSGDDGHYNPTANLCGFILKYADEESALYEKGVAVAGRAVDSFLSAADVNMIGDGHLNLCYLRLLQDHGGTGNLRSALIERIKLRESEKPDLFADGVALEYLAAFRDELGLIAERTDFVETVFRYQFDSQLEDGTWDVPWSWGGYAEQWAVAKNWWKAYGIIAVMLFWKRFGFI